MAESAFIPKPVSGGAPSNIALTSGLTGILTGGEITVGSGPALYNVAAGVARIMNFTDPANPTFTDVSFGPFVDESPLNIGTELFTTNAINVAGALVKSNAIPTTADRRDSIRLQSLGHADFSTITAITDNQQPAWNVPQALLDYVLALGPINTANDYSANGVNLSMDKSTGTTSQPFINYVNDPDAPNDLPNAAVSPVSFVQQYQDGGGDFTTVLPTTLHDPGQYDDGSGTLAAVSPANRFTVKRISLAGGSNDTVVTYGQALYTSIADAEAAIFAEAPVLSSLVQAIGFRYALIVRGNATDLTDTAQAKFVPILQQTAGGVGTGLTSKCLWFPAETSGNFFTTYRDRDIGPTASFNFNIRAPDDFGTLTKLALVGAPNANFGAAGIIDLNANYGADGEGAGNHNDTDSLTALSGTADVFQEFDLSGAVPSLSSGDNVGIQVDHISGIGTTINYLGIVMEYTL